MGKIAKKLTDLVGNKTGIFQPGRERERPYLSGYG